MEYVYSFLGHTHYRPVSYTHLDVYKRQDHIKEMENAMFEEGVPCLGYITWGPIDILASMCNMDKSYGFVYVNRTNKDMRDLKRIPKKSFYWISKVFKSNGEDLD